MSSSIVKPKIPRRQIMLDQSVQGTLMKRVTTYWFLCLVAVMFMSWLWESFRNPDLSLQVWVRESLLSLIVPMAGSLLLLPLAWADMIRVSNRMVAPVHSVRTAIRRMLLGDDVPPLTPRRDDFWQDFTGQFNRFTARARIDLNDLELTREVADGKIHVGESPQLQELGG
ncbi:MAG: hypothetical protein KDB27_27150 [Planctomycetales bacterium]|nr:hypothetical protein [Planctomycetales bacterium]